jgi:hypothetical protein
MKDYACPQYAVIPREECVMVHIFSPSTGRLPRKRIGTAASVLTLAAVLALSGCASVPPPDGAMSQAQAQLQAARDAGAADYAPVDLGFAQDKFQQAQAAMAARKYDLAADLAEEASADAMLARTKARLGAARAEIQSKLEENNRVRTQNEEAKAEAQQHAAQQQAALATQQAAQQAGGGAPAPAGSAALPAQEPLPDLPAPSSSTLNAPLPQQDQGQPGQGFQNVPEPSQQPNGGQP